MNAVSLGPLDCPIKSHLTLVIKFRLIADQIDHDILSGVLFDFFVPLGQIIKSLIASDIVSKEHTVRTSVEYSGYWLVRFLAGGIPDLHLDDLVFDTETIGAELHSDGDLVLSLEFIVHNSLHQATLADTSVANNDEFEHVVVLLLQRFVRDVFEGLLLKFIDLCLLHCA